MVVFVLCAVMWTFCHRANGGMILINAGFSSSSVGDAGEMRTYTVVDGLVGPVVPVIFQDSQGLLWFGSESGGVTRFDGETFEQFRLEDDLSSGVTEQILEDRWGHIWFLTRLPAQREGTVSYFNGTYIEKVGVATCLAVDSSGDIWAANNRRLTHYTSLQRSSFATERPHNEETEISSVKSTHHWFPGITDAAINVLFQSKDGKFWIGGSTGGSILLLSFDPNSDSKFKRIDTNIVWSTTDEMDATFAIHDIAQGPYGVEHLWFAGRNLLLRFDGETLHQVLPNLQSDDQTDIHNRNPDDTKLYYDPFRGYIWFGSDGKIGWFEGNNLRKLYQNDADQLSQYQDYRILFPEFFGTLKMQDTLGNLWFASPTGAHQYNPDRGLNEVYTIQGGLGSNNIQTIFEGMDSKIWFGHDNGVTVFNPRSAFVSFKIRPALGNYSVRQIYGSTRGTWFSIPDGVAFYGDPGYGQTEDRLYQQELHPAHAENTGGRTEIIKIFRNQGADWFISRTEQTPTEWVYTFFIRADEQFTQLSIRVQKTENGRHSHPAVLISSPQNPYIAFGGWVFKPYSEGLKGLSPQGTRTFAFQNSPRFEDLPKIKHGPSAIIDMHTDKDKYGKVWCYLADGTLQSYPNLDPENIPKIVLPDILPMTQIKPLRLPNPKVTSGTSSENTAPKWFFNSEKKQIIYWDIEKLEDPTAIEGDFNASPLAIWENADVSETTFIFSDHLKKYSGTQLIHEEKHEENVLIAEVRAALLTNTQVLWLATKQGAVRYNGKTLETYDIEDGFLVNDLRDVAEDTWGHIWFATWGGGAVRYDGETFSPVTTKDGLAHNNISDIHQSSQGHIWFATEGGITRYTPTDGALPFCNITRVRADETDMDISDTDLVLPSRVRDITFHFEGINPLRLRRQLTYEFKLLGLGTNDWTWGSTRTPTRLLQNSVTQTFATGAATDPSTPEGPSVTYHGLKPGNYTFLVKTFRKGWPYTSAPTTFNFTIAPPFWAQWQSYLLSLVLVVVFIAVVAFLFARLLMHRRRAARLHAEMQQREEAETQRIRAELHEARNIQSGLLPTEAPQTEGLDVAGMSRPATQVGGDFYDYLSIDGKHLAIAVADAAGKGLRGALNAVLTNGMLNEIAQIQYNADAILTHLNTSLAPRLYGRTFIALNLAIIDTARKQMRYANAGQPYPILKRGDTLIEIEVSELPLGSMKKVKYDQETLELDIHDILIFYTDGVIEALNSAEEMYGTERLKSVIAEAPQDLSAEELIAYIFKDIQEFVQTAEQYDDITIVVVKHQPITQ